MMNSVITWLERIPLSNAEEIERQVHDSATLQTRLAQLSCDPMVDRLRKVWQTQHLNEGQPREDDESPGGGMVVVDRYCLLEKIGTGGMGQVWKAKPISGISPAVALKLVKPGLDSKSIIERFELERTALGMMDHPSIARVLDGGSTDQGQSYFVMELVEGSSITEYCHQHQLGIEQRLKLFVQVCRAVQHAHQKGIIHRDLKPLEYSGNRVRWPAAAQGHRFWIGKGAWRCEVSSDHSQLTEYGALLGTFLYMSPEQVELNTWDIDTRSDIYSLGVVLYELLTGTTPIQRPADGQQSLLTMLQTIREAEPPRPSERLSSSAASNASSPNPQGASPGPASSAKPQGASPGSASSPQPQGASPVQRSSHSAAWIVEPSRQILRRDLDWIVMKAIEKKRERRYQTADSLAQDIDRYLTGQPVTARPPSAVYRLGKFVKKHRGAVTVAMALLIVTMAGVASLLWSLQADNQKRAVYAAASYSSIINELNLLSVNRHSGWSHRGLQLIQVASTIETPLRDSRQLRYWAAAMLTTPDFDMNVRQRFTADLSPTDITYSPSGTPTGRGAGDYRVAATNHYRLNRSGYGPTALAHTRHQPNSYGRRK